MNNAQTLAEYMGVSEADILCLARSVINSMAQDKALSTFVEADADQQRQILEAHIAHAVKKFEQFQTRYMTNPAAREAFIMAVYNAV